MPMSSKFLTESTVEKIVKIGQYLAKIWTKYDSLLFFGPPCTVIAYYNSMYMTMGGQLDQLLSHWYPVFFQFID